MRNKAWVLASSAALLLACSGGGSSDGSLTINGVKVHACSDLASKPVIDVEWKQGCVYRKPGESKDTIAIGFSSTCKDGTKLWQLGDIAAGRTGEPGHEGKITDAE